MTVGARVPCPSKSINLGIDILVDLVLGSRDLVSRWDTYCCRSIRYVVQNNCICSYFGRITYHDGTQQFRSTAYLHVVSYRRVAVFGSAAAAKGNTVLNHAVFADFYVFTHYNARRVQQIEPWSHLGLPSHVCTGHRMVYLLD